MPKCFSCSSCKKIFSIGSHEFELQTGDTIATITVPAAVSRVQKGVGQITDDVVCRNCIKRAIKADK